MPPHQRTQTPAFSSYHDFYKECATYPELPKFRRFTAQWTKRLYDDGEALMAKEEELNGLVAKLGRRPSGAVTHLDFPRRLADNDALRRTWLEYDKLLKTYSENLYLFHQTTQMPVHAPYFSGRLRKHNHLFFNGQFGPTNESDAAAAYLDPYARDFVACVGMDSADFLASLCMNSLHWIERHIMKRVRGVSKKKKPRKGSTKLTDVQYSTLLDILDWLTCAFVPLLFTATMFALTYIRNLNSRIGVVSVLSFFFAASAKFLSSRISRGEIFAYTAAFFAVASVFVSTNDCSCSNPP